MSFSQPSTFELVLSCPFCSYFFFLFRHGGLTMGKVSVHGEPKFFEGQLRVFTNLIRVIVLTCLLGLKFSCLADVLH